MPSLFIADDNPSIRRLIRSLLEHEGYEICCEAEDGVQAIDSAASVLKRALPKTRIIPFTLFDEPIGKQLTAAIRNPRHLKE